MARQAPPRWRAIGRPDPFGVPEQIPPLDDGTRARQSISLLTDNLVGGSVLASAGRNACLY